MTLLERVEAEAREGWSGDALCVGAQFAREIAQQGDEAQAVCLRLRAECFRLKDWLLKIEGGDNPCRDENTLRQWAYCAVVLGRPSPMDAVEVRIPQQHKA